jgi:hypothetical protein
MHKASWAWLLPFPVWLQLGVRAALRSFLVDLFVPKIKLRERERACGPMCQCKVLDNLVYQSWFVVSTQNSDIYRRHDVNSMPSDSSQGTRVTIQLSPPFQMMSTVILRLLTSSEMVWGQYMDGGTIHVFF